MSDDILNFKRHRKHLEENASLARCARCGKSIVATSTRCPECGVHFQGEAQDYLHPIEQPAGSRIGWGWVVIVVLLVALLISAMSIR